MERIKTYMFTVGGLVQGVGFRPFIYRLANEFGLQGWVNNTNENVQVLVNADTETFKRFMEQIWEQAPRASEIESIDFREVDFEVFENFRIIKSESLSDEVTRVSPDIAVCEDCLEDMKLQPNRINYPFLNCTNCGPRFTIVQDLPYDREHTTMNEFEMCGSCRREYENVLDRRFHAQPTACRDCGPVYSLEDKLQGDAEIVSEKEPHPDSEPPAEDTELVTRTALLIDKGKIVAIKGLGGFFMACDALNEKAVRGLRDSKQREGKPFAVMFENGERAQEYCEVSKAEAEQLKTWRRPIVILQNRRFEGKQLSPSVSNGFPTTGVMLPYMPFHYLLFEKLNTPAIVMTSGNLSDEPILIDNTMAESVLGPASDAVLHYNRDIHNRCDDSVVHLIKNTPRMLRRSRGYVPNPINLNLPSEGIFAAGAELVNCFAIGKGTQAIMSQHIGDLKNFETYEFYRETFDRYKRLFRLDPELVAHDLHPDYLSTRFAKELDLPVVKVQHHHAHIASVLAEHKLDEKVIGVSFDGTGLGDDGNIWGSEFMVCDLSGYERISHLEYLSMPGGDKAAHEPWRMAVSLLYSLHGRNLTELNLPFLRKIDASTLDLIYQSIDKKINCPLSSGAGRLFDGVAALLDLCSVSQFHAEAPMRLESAIRPGEKGVYPYGKEEVIGLNPLIDAIVMDLDRGTDIGIISARFHNTISKIILETVSSISKDYGINKVALSGGTFQNKYLSGMLETNLEEKGFEVIVPCKVPANDGGIALGQLAIAARQRSLGQNR